MLSLTINCICSTDFYITFAIRKSQERVRKYHSSKIRSNFVLLKRSKWQTAQFWRAIRLFLFSCSLCYWTNPTLMVATLILHIAAKQLFFSGADQAFSSEVVFMCTEYADFLKLEQLMLVWRGYGIILTGISLAQDRSWSMQEGQMEAETQFPEFPRISKSIGIRAVLR